MSHERQGVVVHIHKPEREHIVTDPEWLHDRAAFGMDYHDDAEVPVHEESPVHVKAVSWLEDGEWKRHDFDEPQQHVAHLGARRTVTEADGSHYDGIMIALVPPTSVAKDLALDDGTESVDNLHITLAYLGDIDEYSKEMVADLPEIIEAWAETQKPMQARTQGAGTFVPAEEDGQHVLWAAVDVPGLHRVHTDLVDMLRSKGYQPREDHSFTPHITLSYGKHHWRFLPKIASVEFEVDEVWCCIGGEWQSYPIGG
jgi:2'-5' RNA ligase